MINNRRNVSLYAGELPVMVDGRLDRAITNGPLYGKEDVLALCSSGQLHLWSKGAVTDAQKWALDVMDLCALISLAVRHGDYLRSEWCEQKPNGPWAACDAYLAVRPEWIEAVHKEIEITWYLKFAIAKTGQMLLSASNHPEGT